jgi:hypothetical protein
MPGFGRANLIIVDCPPCNSDSVAKALCRSMRLCNDKEVTDAAVEEDPEQQMWESLSKWLQQHKLKSLELPIELPVCPGWLLPNQQS